VKLLLDTHVFLWWRSDAPQLKGTLKRTLQDSATTVYLSAAVACEIVIKRALGRLDFEGSVGAAAAEEGFEMLPITLAHADEVARLPEHHRDPFDRLLIAQARREGLTLATHDRLLKRYDGVDLLLA
jgi:PIN domain nuclease of toxin-antitoxin system